MFRDVPGCSGMFRNVPACSGMFHVPDFIDCLKKVPLSGRASPYEPLFAIIRSTPPGTV